MFRFLKDPACLALLLVGAFLLFHQLGQRPFWQDEAETANLAKNVLEYGVPRVTDDVNLISQEEGREYGEELIWSWSPWLQIYVSALGQAVGGSNTYAGRLPFAVAALVVLAATYLFVRRYYPDPRDRMFALLSLAFLVFCVAFLLYMRQNRYYSLGALLTLTSLPAFVSSRPSRWEALAAGLSFGLMFHANYLLLFSFGPAVLGAKVLVDRRLPRWDVLLVMAASAAVLILPGFAIYGIGKQGGMMDWTRIPSNLEQYFSILVQFMLPLPIAAVLLWRFRRVFSWRGPRLTDDKERLAAMIVLTVAINLLILALIPQRFHRYLVHLYPMLAILFAWATIKLFSWQKVAGVAFGIMLMFTNWLHILPMEWIGIVNRPWHTEFDQLPYPNIPMKLYLTELFDGPPDVNANIIEHFREHAEPDDAVLITYGDLPLMFYTNIKVMGGLQKDNPEFLDDPEWVVQRAVSRTKRDGSLVFSVQAALEHIASDEYDAMVLDFPDEDFGARADPFFHRFKALGEPYRPLVVYKRRPQADNATADSTGSATETPPSLALSTPAAKLAKEIAPHDAAPATVPQGGGE